MRRWKELIQWYPLLHVVMLAGIGMTVQNQLCEYGVSGWMLCLLMAFAALFYVAVKLWKVRFVWTMAVSLFVIGSILLLSKQTEEIRRFFAWYVGMGEASPVYYIPALAITVLAAVGIGSLAAAYDWLQRILAVFCAAALIISLVTNQPFTEGAVAWMSMYLLLTAMDLCQKYQEKQERTMRRRIIVSLLPIILLAGFLVLTARKVEEPYDWKFVKDIIEFVDDLFDDVGTRIEYYVSDKKEDAFTISFGGYSDVAEIGNGRVEGNGTALLVSFYKTIHANMYLAGSVWDTFTGDGWEAYGEIPPEEPDYLTTNAAKYQNGEVQELLQDMTKVGISYEEAYTTTLFWPEKTKRLSIPKDVWRQEKNRFQFMNPKGSGYMYQVVWQQMNLGSRVWDTFVRYQLEQPKEADAYTAYVYDTYTQDPELVPAVERYLEEITAGKANPYDRLLAVEDTLRGYTYALLPEQVPEGEDFLETFLLETQEGYCTYFATAMTLLARELGFPARYVQGYFVESAGKGYAEPVPVDSSMAHAWAEVWLDGIGWVPFEATPGYGELHDVFWEDMGTKPNIPEFEEHPEIPEEIDQEDVQGTTPEKKLGKKVYQWIVRILIGLAVLAAAAMGVFMILEQRHRKREHSATEEERFVKTIFDILYILQMSGLYRETWETLSVYHKRLSESEEVGELVRPIPLAAYEALCYGEIPPTKTDLTVAEEQKEALYDYYCRYHNEAQNLWLLAQLRYGQNRE